MSPEEQKQRAKLYRAVDDVQTRAHKYAEAGYPAEAALVMAALDAGARVTTLVEFDEDDRT